MAVSLSPKGDPTSPRRPLPQRHISSHKQLQLGVDIAEYMHYASITRAKESARNREYESKRGPVTLLGLLKDRFHKGHREDQNTLAIDATAELSEFSEEKSSEKERDGAVIQSAPIDARSDVWDSAARDAELYSASRAMRTAGWGSAFYCKYHFPSFKLDILSEYLAKI